MTMISGNKIALTRFNGTTIRTDHYASIEDMLDEILMNSGDKLLPPAIREWEEQIRRDNCTHKRMKDHVCLDCDMHFDPL